MATPHEADPAMAPATPPLAVVRPPNRPALDRQLESLSLVWQQKEERRRFLSDRLRGLRDAQALHREERDRINDERTKVDEQLNNINKEVDAKRDQTQKLRAHLPYLSEERIQDQIQNLEYQLRKHNFKPSEEKKIVIEIDRLNRSRKQLKEHNVYKTELDALRATQRRLRDRRDQLFRGRRDLKKRDDQAKRDLHDLREELDSLKAQQDELAAERRRLAADFRQQESDYNHYLYERREEQRRRRKEEKAQQEEEKRKEIEEIKANAEPYEDELQLLANLTSYCLRFELPSTPVFSGSGSGSGPSRAFGSATTSNFLSVPGGKQNVRRRSYESATTNTNTSNTNGASPLTPGSTGSSNYATPLGVTPTLTPVDAKEVCFAYKKDEQRDDDALFAGVSASKKSSRRNSRNERRNSKAKALTHSPDVFAQFGRFGLKPPATTREVAGVVEALKDKQHHFEGLADGVRVARRSGGAETASATASPAIAIEPATPSSTSARLAPPNNLALNTTLSVTPPSVNVTPSSATPPAVLATPPIAKATPTKQETQFDMEEAFPCLPASGGGFNGVGANGGFFPRQGNNVTTNVTHVTTNVTHVTTNTANGVDKVKADSDIVQSISDSLKKDLKIADGQLGMHQL